jgi:hypothetical protein
LDNGQELSQDWKADPPENRSEGQTLPLRHVPQAQPEACQDAGSLVLPQLPERKRPCGDLRIRVGLNDLPRPQRMVIIANEHKSRSLSMLLAVLLESITHINFRWPATTSSP